MASSKLIFRMSMREQEVITQDSLHEIVKMRNAMELLLSLLSAAENDTLNALRAGAVVEDGRYTAEIIENNDGGKRTQELGVRRNRSFPP